MIIMCAHKPDFSALNYVENIKRAQYSERKCARARQRCSSMAQSCVMLLFWMRKRENAWVIGEVVCSAQSHFSQSTHAGGVVAAPLVRICFICFYWPKCAQEKANELPHQESGIRAATVAHQHDASGIIGKCYFFHTLS